MLRAVVERGMTPDVLLGCSVGAFNAAALAAEPTVAGVERMESVWRGIKDEILPPGRLSALRLVARRGPAMTTNDGLHWLLDQLPFDRFEEAEVPLHVVATSLRTGRAQWFSVGGIREPILASSALPAVFPPIEIGGELYIDGGVVDNVPITRAVELGATRVVVFHVGNVDPPRTAPKRPLDALLAASAIARNHRFAADLDALRPHAEIIVLPAIEVGSIRYNDFSRSAELMERAHASTAHFLDVRARDYAELTIDLDARMASATRVSVGP
jgi:NTE family protein